jgi:hypothetical protein
VAASRNLLTGERGEVGPVGRVLVKVYDLAGYALRTDDSPIPERRLSGGLRSLAACWLLGWVVAVVHAHAAVQFHDLALHDSELSPQVC